jgi:Legionella pneumophila major outer membrane protein precursor
MKRICIVLKTLVAAAVCGSSVSLAAPPVQPVSLQNVDARVAALQAELAAVQARLDAAGTLTPPPPGMAAAPMAAYGPCGGCAECNPSNWLIQADWLYWKAHRNGLDYAILDTAADPVLGVADVARIRPDHESGFRIAIFRQSSNGMDFGVRYTNYDSRPGDTLTDPTGNSSATRLHPDVVVGSPDVGDQNVVAATSGYDLEYELLDLEAGYRLEFNCNSSVRPFTGIRFAQIDQQIDSRYGDAADFSTNVTQVLESVDMDSWGLFGGTEVQWGLGGRGLHVFGRGAAGLHHARFDSSFAELEVDEDVFVARVTDGDRRIVASLEAQVGLGYQLYQGCRGGIDLQVGYDIQKWFNMADFLSFEDDVLEASLDRNDASLGLDGWFVRVMVTR